MDLDTVSNRESLINIFPDLADDPNFHIVSPDVPIYNCIAWAMGFESRWVACVNKSCLDSIGPRFVWWPDGIEVSERCEALISAFVTLGFEPSDNANFEPDYDKAVLYQKDDKWTHASRIVAEGVEHSKFGSLWDAIHGMNRFSNSIYGVPYAYMRRLHSQKKHYLDLHPLKIAGMTVHEDQAEQTLARLKRVLGASKS